MLIPLSLNTQYKTIDNYVFRYKNDSVFEWLKQSVKFIDNSTKLTSIHSIIKQFVVRKINDYDIEDDDNDLFIINIIKLQIHLIRFYNQNQSLILINDFVLELLHAADLIFHFLFLVRFKFINEIYNRSYTIKIALCVVIFILLPSVFFPHSVFTLSISKYDFFAWLFLNNVEISRRLQ